MSEKKSAYKPIEDWKAVTAYASVHEDDGPGLIQPTELNRNKTQTQVFVTNDVDEGLQCFAEEKIAENLEHQAFELKKSTPEIRRQIAKEAEIGESGVFLASAVKNRVVIIDETKKKHLDKNSQAEKNPKFHYATEICTEDGNDFVSIDNQSDLELESQGRRAPIKN